MNKTKELISHILTMCININKIYERLNQLTERIVRIEEATQDKGSVQNSTLEDSPTNKAMAQCLRCGKEPTVSVTICEKCLGEYAAASVAQRHS